MRFHTSSHHQHKNVVQPTPSLKSEATPVLNQKTKTSVVQIQHVTETNLVKEVPTGLTKHEHVNQDRLLIRIAPNFKHKLRGIFVLCDGHGDSGERAAEYFSYHLMQETEEFFHSFDSDHNLTAAQGPSDAEVSRFFRAMFLKLDESFKKLLVEEHHITGRDTDKGCTAQVLAMWENRIFVANVGDSRSIVLAKKTADVNLKDYDIVFTTVDHDVHGPDVIRALHNGGQLYAGSEYLGANRKMIPEDSIFHDLKGLQMTRSMGDYSLKTNNILIAEPDLYVVNVGSPIILVVASDGLWDYVAKKDRNNNIIPSTGTIIHDGQQHHTIRSENDVVRNVILKHVDGTTGTLDARQACEELKTLCRSEKHAANLTERLYWDDMTVMVSQIMLFKQAE